MKTLVVICLLSILFSEASINWGKSIYYNKLKVIPVSEFQEAPLSYPCERHQCSCTIETCKLDCCCLNLNAVAPIVIISDSESIFTTIVSIFICKKKPKEILQELMAKEKIFHFCFFSDAIVNKSNIDLEDLLYFTGQVFLTQFYHEPSSPPPDFSYKI